MQRGNEEQTVFNTRQATADLARRLKIKLNKLNNELNLVLASYIRENKFGGTAK